MQLVAYGAQDIYLTGQPQITFFKSVYRRHTNFATESIRQTINGTPGFNNTVSITISRNGDLLNGVVVEYSPNNMLSGVTGFNPGNNSPPSAPIAYVGANLGHSIFNRVEVEIGGQLIDRQYGTWLTIWDYLTNTNPNGVQGSPEQYGAEPTSKNTPTNQDGVVSTLYDIMSFNHRGTTTLENASDSPNKAYVPLQFWFCKNPGLAVPLIALQYHEVKINLYFNGYSSILASSSTITSTGNEFNGFSVYGEYVYLDTTERRQFAQNAHEYLIDQIQVNQAVTNNSPLLTFNHPVKELIWLPTPVLVSSQNQSGGSSPSSSLASGNYKITLNGTDRFTERDLTYFTRYQVNQVHTGFGSILWPNSIAVYSFALRPEEHQPSGTCNFSRIDTAILDKPSNQSIDIYAVNYNILRIMSGMGGLAYSN